MQLRGPAIAPGMPQTAALRETQLVVLREVALQEILRVEAQTSKTTNAKSLSPMTA
jgi:hypothetical protein